MKYKLLMIYVDVHTCMHILEACAFVFSCATFNDYLMFVSVYA